MSNPEIKIKFIRNILISKKVLYEEYFPFVPKVGEYVILKGMEYIIINVTYDISHKIVIISLQIK